jgi:tetratricopeptide (TPR) repeat protein
MFFVQVAAYAQNTAGDWLEKAEQTDDIIDKVQCYRRAIKIDENMHTAYYGRGMAYLQSQNTADAIRDFDRAINISPKTFKYFAGRAKAHTMDERYLEAIEDLTQAELINPQNTDNHMNRAMAYIKTAQWTKALNDLDFVLKQLPTHGTALAQKGIVLLALFRENEALEQLQLSLKYEPTNINALMGFGAYYERKNDKDQALDQYNQAIQIDPNYDDALNAKARLIKIKEEPSPPPPGFQPSIPAPPTGIYASTLKRKYALVIGNSGYLFHSNLQGRPLNDAEDMKKKLEEFGFNATLLKDLTQNQFINSLKLFYDKIKDADLVFVFYAGHGIEFEKERTNFFIPIDQKITNFNEAQSYAIPLQGIVQNVALQSVKYGIIVSDACRTDRGIGLPVDVTTPKVNMELVIAYATSAGTTSGNGIGRNGIYTGVFLQKFEPNKRFDDILMETRKEVHTQTGDVQVPDAVIKVDHPIVFDVK